MYNAIQCMLCIFYRMQYVRLIMEILYDRSGNTLKVTLWGELDESSAESVRNSLDRNILLSDAGRIIFDFSRLSFMDSAGIGVLVGRYKKFAARSVGFFITSPNPTVDKILKLSGIYTIMPVVETA